MAHVVVLGGTGYAGGHIAAEAVGRGLTVTSWSRSLPEEQIGGVEYRTGDLLDAAVLEEALSGADVVVGALSPRGALDGKLREVYSEVARVATAVVRSKKRRMLTALTVSSEPWSMTLRQSCGPMMDAVTWMPPVPQP